MKTAKKILEIVPFSSDIKFTVDERLHERDAGEYEGKSLDLYAEVNKFDKERSSSLDFTFKEKMNFTPGKGVESIRISLGKIPRMHGK